MQKNGGYSSSSSSSCLFTKIGWYSKFSKLIIHVLLLVRFGILPLEGCYSRLKLPSWSATVCPLKYKLGSDNNQLQEERVGGGIYM